MPRKLPPKPDEKPQRDRFIEGARELGASEDPEDFERVFKAVMRHKPEIQSTVHKRKIKASSQ